MNTNTIKRILLADASPVSQDIVNLILGQRGHQITIAADQKDIMAQLQSFDFDIAIIDDKFGAPDDQEKFESFLSQNSFAKLPYIIALTDNAEFAEHNPKFSELSDLVIVRPLRIDEIIPIIESEIAQARTADELPLTKRESTYQTDITAAMPFDDMGYSFLYFPRDFYGNARNNVSQLIAERGAPDAVIITEPPTGDQIELMGRIRGTHASPFIDLTGRLPNRCDISVQAALPPRSEIIHLVDRFRETRGQIHDDFARTNNDEELVLVRMYCTENSLDPRYDASIRCAVSYNTIVNPAKILTVASELKRKALVSGTFFDRYNTCPTCESARIQVREVCTQCQDSQLIEQAYVHHYRCAWQAPLSDFKVGDDLICPKCSYELKHFGKDYDKPGITLICSRFGHHNSDPDVRFICLDCDHQFASEDAISRDIESYEITQRGLEFIEAGRVILGQDKSNFHLSDLPFGLIVELNQRTAQCQQENTDFALVSVGYRNLRSLAEEYNIGDIERTRDLLMTLLREALPGKVSVHQSNNYDYALAYGSTAERVQEALTRALPATKSQLTVPVDAVGTVYSSQEFRGVQ